MPIKKTSCNCCGENQIRCPECDSIKVTPRDNPDQRPPNQIVDHGGPNEITYRHICWECGWGEEITVTIERSSENI